MCGIMGYIGHRDALPILLDGLRRLEYRGYDSAGVAVLVNGHIEVRKAAGKLSQLEKAITTGPYPLRGTVGIGHTRWATHGLPSEANAHPHGDCTGQVVVIHNGIIENFLALREQLLTRGHHFRSDTDSEVLSHLIEEELYGLRAAPSPLLSLEEAVRRAVRQAGGAYAMVVMCCDQPDRIVAVRQISPLVVGLGGGETILASDIPALLRHTRDVIVVEDGEMAVLRPGGVTMQTLDGVAVEKAAMRIAWDAQMAEKGGFPHFMLKEINEQPRALEDTMLGRLGPSGTVVLDGVTHLRAQAAGLKKIWIIACGTAAHAGLAGRWFIEHWARIPVEPDLASEFRYRDLLIGPDALAIAISQSGETADTLAAVREAQRRGARVLAITNVVGSTLSREADDVLYIRAGPEIAVASTKAYVAMLAAQAMLALDLGVRRGTLSPPQVAVISQQLKRLPDLAREVLTREPLVVALADRLATREHIFFIGRGLDHAVAMEGSLKLKEISYVHSEALAAGELKHGTLALVSPGVPVFALITQPRVHEKMLSSIQEVKARGGEVIAVAHDSDTEITKYADSVLRIPDTDAMLAPILAIIPLQLFAYHVARIRGNDIDQPRNLAKSVTVE
ncbi:MAG: glutamine--fructose-6-phosphate transaminase (isomerizing) [Gemmatimonadetes bacterium]|nr:glutamine--fructose-6-phosphate transaminase (isomerizing) [Gemmatimonadota bacterium]